MHQIPPRYFISRLLDSLYVKSDVMEVLNDWVMKSGMTNFLLSGGLFMQKRQWSAIARQLFLSHFLYTQQDATWFTHGYT